MTALILVLLCLAIAGRELYLYADARTQRHRLDDRFTGLEERLSALGDSAARAREEIGGLEQRLTEAQDTLTTNLRDLQERLANIQRAIARDMSRLTALEHDAPAQFDQRLTALETQSRRRAPLDRLERVVGELRRDLLDRVKDEVRLGTAFPARLTGTDLADRPRVTDAFDRWATSAGLQLRATEPVADPPWQVTCYLTGDLPDLLREARDAVPGTPLDDLITALAATPGGMLRVGDFTAVRTSAHEVLAGLLGADADASTAADRLSALPPDLRCRLPR